MRPAPESSLQTLLRLGRLTTLRHWRLRWKETAVLILTLAAGLAVFVSIRLANRSAIGSFSNFVEAVTGRNDLSVVSPAGRLPVSALPDLAEAASGTGAILVPVGATSASLPGDSLEGMLDGKGTVIRFLGLDLIALQNLPEIRRQQNRILFGEGERAGGDFWERLRDPAGVYLAPPLARSLGIRPGERFEVLLNDSVRELHLLGLLPEPREGEVPAESLMVADLAAFQQLTDSPDFIDRVEVILPGESSGKAADAGRVESVRQTLEAAGEANGLWIVERPGNARESGATMTAAFRLNLLVLSLIALFVGLLMILQALEAAVVRRREEIATLRALGVTSRIIRRAWVVESMVLGLGGTGLGLLLGWLGGLASVGAVSRTVTTLYGGGTAPSPALTMADVGLTLGLGLTASLVAGWWPAREAASVDPAQVLRRGQVSYGLRAVRHGGWFGLPLLIAGVAALRLPAPELNSGAQFPLGGYLAAVLLLSGAALVTPTLLPLGSRLLRPLARRVATVQVARARLSQPLGRHRLAVAGLVVASGMAFAMSFMIGSFESTMRVWIERNLAGDLYVSPAGAQGADSRNRIPEATWRRLASAEGIREAVPTLLHRISLRGLETTLIGSPFQNPAMDPIWITPPPPQVHLVTGTTGIEPARASESFSRRFGLQSGDILSLPTPYGSREVILTGIYAEYGNEQGSLQINFETAARWYGSRAANRLTLLTEPEVPAETIAARWSTAFPGLTIRTNAGLRETVLKIFHQTFAVTYALQLIAVVVALAGLALALVTLAFEMRAETAALRALGWGRRHLMLTGIWESLGLALAGLSGGFLLSFALGYILIYDINRRSFGWTLQTDTPWLLYAAFCAILLTAAAAVGGWIGRWSASLSILREE